MWISVRNWRKFQHYDPEKRTPAWIKCYLGLLHDDAYLSLTGSRRALLHGLWMEYALSGTSLRLDVQLINRRLELNAKMKDLEALRDAGFIEFVASKPLADRYQSASPEVEVEKKRKDPLSYSPPDRTPIDPEAERAALAKLEAMGEHVSLEQKLRASIALAEARKATP